MEQHIKLNRPSTIFLKSGQRNPAYEDGQTVERKGENRKMKKKKKRGGVGGGKRERKKP